MLKGFFGEIIAPSPLRVLRTEGPFLFKLDMRVDKYRVIRSFLKDILIVILRSHHLTVCKNQLRVAKADSSGRADVYSLSIRFFSTTTSARFIFIQGAERSPCRQSPRFALSSEHRRGGGGLTSELRGFLRRRTSMYFRTRPFTQLEHPLNISN